MQVDPGLPSALARGDDGNGGKRPDRNKLTGGHYIEKDDSELVALYSQVGLLQKREHKRCPRCLQVRDHDHRQAWKVCKEPCPGCGPDAQHHGQLCPRMVALSRSAIWWQGRMNMALPGSLESGRVRAQQKPRDQDRPRFDERSDPGSRTPRSSPPQDNRPSYRERSGDRYVPDSRGPERDHPPPDSRGSYGDRSADTYVPGSRGSQADYSSRDDPEGYGFRSREVRRPHPGDSWEDHYPRESRQQVHQRPTGRPVPTQPPSAYQATGRPPAPSNVPEPPVSANTISADNSQRMGSTTRVRSQAYSRFDSPTNTAILERQRPEEIDNYITSLLQSALYVMEFCERLGDRRRTRLMLTPPMQEVMRAIRALDDDRTNAAPAQNPQEEEELEDGEIDEAEGKRR